MHEALNNWGSALLEQAKRKAGPEAERLFAECSEKLTKAESLASGSAAYNLACLTALQGSEQECREWLEKARRLGTLPSPEHLVNDTDLDSVRDREWFQVLLVGQ